MIRLIALKEFRSLLQAPSTWLILVVLQIYLTLYFLGWLDTFLQLQTQLALIANAPGATQVIIPPLFGGYKGMMMVMMILAPIFTMRQIAEERRNHTMALLMAAPICGRHIVLGKFFGLMLFLSLIIFGCSAMTLVLALGTHMDFGLLFANMAGMLLLTASFVALGLYISSLTAQPVVAAIGALLALLSLWRAEESAADGNPIWHALTPTGHFQNFNAGLLDSSDLAYFVLFCAFFLLLTMRRIHNNRLYG